MSLLYSSNTECLYYTVVILNVFILPRKTQDELNEKRHAVSELTQALDERQLELQQRVSQVSNLF